MDAKAGVALDGWTVEFTSLIIAQRGFQANARTISSVNQTLEELVNLER